MPKSPRRYAWPASRIDRDVMFELHRASRESGLPISQLIGDAVHAAMNSRLDRTQPIGFTQGQPRPAA
jgi:hypothetical protein